MGVVACGSRTNLEPVEGEGPPFAEAGDSPGDAVEEATDQGGGYPYCDPRLGPIPASEVPEGSFISRCDRDFPHCVEVGGQWGCCHGPGPYIGPTGSCIL
jgi:hypothetical protein